MIIVLVRALAMHSRWSHRGTGTNSSSIRAINMNTPRKTSHVSALTCNHVLWIWRFGLSTLWQLPLNGIWKALDELTPTTSCKEPSKKNKIRPWGEVLEFFGASALGFRENLNCKGLNSKETGSIRHLGFTVQGLGIRHGRSTRSEESCYSTTATPPG